MVIERIRFNQIAANSNEKLGAYNKAHCLETISNAILGFLKFSNERKESKISKKSVYQKVVLEHVFNITQYPSKLIKETVAIILNLDLKVINIWFQNKRNIMVQCRANKLPFKLDKKRSTMANHNLKMHLLLLELAKLTGPRCYFATQRLLCKNNPF
ncbi:HD-8 [Ecytonucleospora hepatopenaei]|uniref:HD-8 n=1 Tax=Ecytonucleospora hepatopenaei TaxID=646526 RepID=A0A1W0E4K2_9MICR|nr:HD-8 [Ecytonucleospora hepatopenaei]